MRKELADSCQGCEYRPACELAGQKYEQLERAASALGFTVTEVSVVCRGRKPGSFLLDLDSTCGARLSAPDLASAEERERIAKLARMDVEASSILPTTQAIVQELRL